MVNYSQSNTWPFQQITKQIIAVKLLFFSYLSLSKLKKTSHILSVNLFGTKLTLAFAGLGKY